MAKPEKDNRSVITILLVWLFRFLVGATFIVSGWAKAIDPWGTIYKVEEYFTVWGLYVPREITLALAVILAICEFSVGVLVFFGSMRRASVWLAAAFMVVMLPLTAYIAIADPVSDCGCFGDFIILSNHATFGKNIVLSAMIVYLMLRNDRVKGVYIPAVQWLVFIGALAYSSSIAIMGYRYQPLIDFRPYPNGSKFVYTDAEESPDNTMFIYEKDGVTQRFAMTELPDSTWTYVDMETLADDNGRALVIYDDGEEITGDILDGVRMQLFLAVPDPGTHYLTRARLANELARFVTAHGGTMTGLVAADGDNLRAWEQLALPEYPVYSAEDTALKELVRGDAGLIFVRDGEIMWKRNLASVNHDVIHAMSSDGTDFLDDEKPEDGARLHLWLSLGFFVWLAIIYILSLPNIILSAYLRRRSAKN